MKKLLPVLVLVLCGQSFAGPSCKTMEFAQIKAMSKEELLREYCLNKDTAAISTKYQSDLRDLAMKASGNGNHQQAQKFMNDAKEELKNRDACESEQSKMMTASKDYLMCPPK